jgi:hypothetical protein
MGTISSGNLTRLFVSAESTYGTLPTPANSDAVDTLGVVFTPKLNRVASPARRGTPGVAQMLPRRSTVDWKINPSMWEPSGTVGTASYFAALLKAGFGSQTLPGLSTTVNDDAASTTGATLTSAEGLAEDDLMTFDVASGARTEITRVTGIDTLDVTFDALSVAPDDEGDAVAGVTYKLATSISQTLSLFLFHEDSGKKEAVSGGIVNEMTFQFDGTTEVQVSFSGPGKELVRTGFSEPSSFAPTGTPVSGVDVGNLYMGGSAFLIRKASVTINNGIELRNSELGTSHPTGYFRGANRRSVKVTVEYYFDDDTLISKAETLTTAEARLLVGATAGKRVGMVIPKIEWEMPEFGDAASGIVLSQDGVALETDGNDEVFAAEL